jgi:MOSC domain-containing protein YiiM
VDKAAYCYPVEHYDYWKKELPSWKFDSSAFGENFATEGMAEDSIHVGDTFSLGSANVVVTQPRMPCYKLGIKFQADDMVRRFLASGRTGFYVAVVREGDVGAGDEIKSITWDSNAVSISEITHLYVAKNYGEAEIHSARRALRVAALPDIWKEHFRERLRQAQA